MQERLRHWKHFSLALSFLTVLRLPFRSMAPVNDDELARSFAFYPLVGGILGFCCLALAWGLSSRVPPLLLGALLVLTLAILTRALHLDGLADLADGMGGGFTPERRLEIMKDSRTGAFGALALVLAVTLKVAALSTIIEKQLWSSILLTPAYSRLGIVLLAHRSPYARPAGGLGKPFLECMTSRDLVMASLFMAALSLPFGLRLSGVCAAALVCGVLLFRRLSHACLGGITGDVLGAANEVFEVVLLAIFASSPSID